MAKNNHKQIICNFAIQIKHKQIMRKFYTAIAIVAMAFTAQAQTTTVETFDTLEFPDTHYNDGSFVGVDGVVWSYGHSRSEGDFQIDGKGIMLRRALDSYLEATIEGGISSFSIEYRKAYTGGNERQLELIINGEQIDTTDVFGGFSGEDATVYTFAVEDINVEGEFTIRIKNVGDGDFNRQVVLDNLTWTSFVDASVKQNNIEGLSIYPNPASDMVNVVSNSLSNKDIVITDLLGKTVLTANVNQSVNISSLKSGVYMMQITQDGKSATRKLIVK